MSTQIFNQIIFVKRAFHDFADAIQNELKELRGPSVNMSPNLNDDRKKTIVFFQTIILARNFRSNNERLYTSDDD